MRDAQIKCRVQNRLFGLMRCVIAEIVPQAQGYSGQFQAGLAAAVVNHFVVTGFGGDICHARAPMVGTFSNGGGEKSSPFRRRVEEYQYGTAQDGLDLGQGV